VTQASAAGAGRCRAGRRSGSAAGRERHEPHGWGRLRDAEAGHKRHALPRRDQGEHGGEVIGVMPGLRLESGCLAGFAVSLCGTAFPVW
jgi:hypothetical protein